MRLHGIPALDFWDLIVAVLGNTNQNRMEQRDLSKNKREVCSPPHTIHKRKQSQGATNVLDNVDFITSNVQSLDGLLALELWDLIVSVFGNISHVSDRTGQLVNGKNKSHTKINAMKDIDSVPSNVQSASQEALLYVFEDNEAVIKRII